MGNTLFNLTDETCELLYLQATDPELDPKVLNDSIESMMGMIEVKACGYANVIKQLEMEQKQAKEVSKMFADKAKVRENNIKRMKEALTEAMKRLEVNSIEAGAFTFKLQNNGGDLPLIIDDPDKVPDNMTKITIEPDNDKIRDYLKDNKCEWAHLGERGKHVVIR